MILRGEMVPLDLDWFSGGETWILPWSKVEMGVGQNRVYQFGIVTSILGGSTNFEP